MGRFDITLSAQGRAHVFPIMELHLRFAIKVIWGVDDQIQTFSRERLRLLEQRTILRFKRSGKVWVLLLRFEAMISRKSPSFSRAPWVLSSGNYQDCWGRAMLVTCYHQANREIVPYRGTHSRRRAGDAAGEGSGASQQNRLTMAVSAGRWYARMVRSLFPLSPERIKPLFNSLLVMAICQWRRPIWLDHLPMECLCQ